MGLGTALKSKFAGDFYTATVLQPIEEAINLVASGRPARAGEIERLIKPPIDNHVQTIVAKPLVVATDLAVSRGLATSLLDQDGVPQYGGSAKLLGTILTAEKNIAESIRLSVNKALEETHASFRELEEKYLGEENPLSHPKQYPAPKELTADDLYDPSKPKAQTISHYMELHCR